MNKVNFWFRIRGLLVYFIIIIFLAAIFANWQADKAIELARADMVRTANNCMHTINPSEIMPEMILADGGNNERYKFLKQHLEACVFSNPAISGVSTYWNISGKTVLGPGSYKKGSVRYSEPAVEYLFQKEAISKCFTERKAIFEAKPYKDNFGSFVSVYCPVLGNNSEVLCVIAADMPEDVWYGNIHAKQTTVFLAVAFVFIFPFIAFWAVHKRVENEHFEYSQSKLLPVLVLIYFLLTTVIITVYTNKAMIAENWNDFCQLASERGAFISELLNRVEMNSRILEPLLREKVSFNSVKEFSDFVVHKSDFLCEVGCMYFKGVRTSEFELLEDNIRKENGFADFEIKPLGKTHRDLNSFVKTEQIVHYPLIYSSPLGNLNAGIGCDYREQLGEDAIRRLDSLHLSTCFRFKLDNNSGHNNYLGIATPMNFNDDGTTKDIFVRIANVDNIFENTILSDFLEADIEGYELIDLQEENKPVLASYNDNSKAIKNCSFSYIYPVSFMGHTFGIRIYSFDGHFVSDMEHNAHAIAVAVDGCLIAILLALVVIALQKKQKEFENCLIKKETEIRDQELMIRELSDNLPLIIYRYAIKEDMKPYFYSSGIERLTGISVDDFLSGKCALFDNIHPDDKAYASEAMKRIADGDRNMSAEYRLKDKKGNYVCFSDHASVIANHDGEPVWLDGFLININDEKKDKTV